MPNFRPRKRKALAEALTEDQIKLLVEGPNPFTDYSTADAVVIEAFGSVEHFRVIFDAYRDELSTLAAPDRPWAWWALEGPGMQAPSSLQARRNLIGSQVSRATCEACREGDHRHCEGFLSNGAACACDELNCGANADSDKEKK
jgi:hypothetical protein